MNKVNKKRNTPNDQIVNKINLINYLNIIYNFSFYFIKIFEVKKHINLMKLKNFHSSGIVSKFVSIFNKSLENGNRFFLGADDAFYS